MDHLNHFDLRTQHAVSSGDAARHPARSFTDKLWRDVKLLDAIFVIFQLWIGFFLIERRPAFLATKLPAAACALGRMLCASEDARKVKLRAIVREKFVEKNLV